MNLWQAVKMAWKSIWGKKGRSALTILGIFIGIAAVMTIVSVMDGYKRAMLAQYAAMGTGILNVNIYNWEYDMDGNDISQDYFPDLRNFCNSLKDVKGVSPQGRLYNVTVSYGTKSTNNMQREWDDMGNPVGDFPPDMYYGSDQYSACNNLTLARGRDLAMLDMSKYNQVCTLGASAATLFFGSANPVGKSLAVGGSSYRVVGVYASRLTENSGNMNSNLDNFIVFPYTAQRMLGGEKPSEFVVKLKDSDKMKEVKTRMNGFLKGLLPDENFYVYSNDQWQQYEAQALGMVGGVLAGIAAISLLVGGIGIMNIMLVTVTERTREIGIRRAIGAQRASIVAQFLIEAGMLCGFGGIVGIIVGTGGSLILGKLLFKMTIYPSFPVTLGAFSLSVAIGVLFGSYPAAKASRLQPVEALRAE
ncbi:MAG: ABC transporter permease [Oscillibacter sp.]|nr:ABC transporter permease [Oscillibacter sp.]